MNSQPSKEDAIEMQVETECSNDTSALKEFHVTTSMIHRSRQSEETYTTLKDNVLLDPPCRSAGRM